MNKHHIWIKKLTYLKQLYKEDGLAGSMAEKNYTWEKQLWTEIFNISYPNHWDHRPLWDFWKISSRDTYYGTIEVHTTDSKSSCNTGIPFVFSVSRPLGMPEDISFACCSAKDTNYMHVLCSARIYSHLPNMHKAGKHISSKYDFTKFCLLQNLEEVVLFIWSQKGAFIIFLSTISPEK